MTTTHTPSTLLALHDADPEGLNEFAAKLAGWHPHPYGAFKWRQDHPEGYDHSNELPRYSTSLDAVAELEAGLTDEEFESFQHWLWDLAYKTVSKESHLRAYISAPAHLRLIAWVLTKQTI